MHADQLQQVYNMPEQGRPGGWMVWAQYVSMGQRHDYSKALADVNVPVLVIHGADDLQSEAASRLYADAFPNAEFVVIENLHISHPNNNPSNSHRLFLNFFQQLDPKGLPHL